MSLIRRVVQLGAPRRGEHADFSRYLVVLTQPNGPAAETYRTLRTNLLYGFIDDPPKTIVLTSPGSGEGKSLTCVNLGIVLAQAGKNTLIVDCDLRRPVIHKVFALHNTKGLVDVLSEELPLREVCQSPVENLKAIATGLVPYNPTELLGSSRFAEFLSQARRDFDHVLMDTSPLGLFSDALILASQADGVVVVFDAQSTRKRAVRQSISSLEAVGANVLGTVMNQVKASEQHDYYGEYPYR